MRLYIGIDLGTSSMKLLLMDEKGTIHNTVTKEYPLEEGEEYTVEYFPRTKAVYNITPID